MTLTNGSGAHVKAVNYTGHVVPTTKPKRNVFSAYIAPANQSRTPAYIADIHIDYILFYVYVDIYIYTERAHTHIYIYISYTFIYIYREMAADEDGSDWETFNHLQHPCGHDQMMCFYNV